MTAQLLNEIISEEQEIVCFDGKNLELLGALREFFISYNLAVVENGQAETNCVYWIICGTGTEIKEIAETQKKSAKGVILIVQNESLEKAAKLARLLNAKCARISDKKISPADARVVFGLLFSETEDVITLSEAEEKQRMPSTHPLAASGVTSQNYPHTSWDVTEKKIQSLMTQVYQGNLHQGPSAKRSLFRLFQFALLGVGLGIATHILLLFIAVTGLVNLDSSFRYLRVTRLATAATHYTGSVITWPLQVLSIETPYQPFLRILHRAEDILTVLEQTKDKAIIDSSVLTGADSLLKSIQDAQAVSAEVLPNVLLIEAELKYIQQKFAALTNTNNINILLDRIGRFLNNVKEMGSGLQSFSQILALFLDSTEQRTYLLLFQNNRELRPTGGFIGSVGFLTVKEGRVLNFDIQDVYEIDGQLKGHVDPPLPIRTILQQEHWYTRDSNWSPSFPESAERALWFLEKSIGVQADGVIAVSLPVVEELLRITGPLELPELNQVVSADEMFQFVYQTTRRDFFPGSTAKKDTLMRLSEILKTKLSSLDTQQLFQLGSLLVSQLQQKNLLFFSRDPRLQKEIVFRGVGGVFPPETACPKDREQFCIRDVFSLVEANLGINKTNSVISRKHTRRVLFANQELTRIDSVLFTNAATEQTVGGGTYRAYLRAYYPVGTQLDSVVINGTETPIQSASSSARPLPYAELVDEAEGFVTLGVALDVPTSLQTRLDVVSRQSFPSVVRAYSLGILKHPGVEESEVSLVVSAPPGYRIKDLVANKQEVSYNIKLRRDENIIVAFDPEVQ